MRRARLLVRGGLAVLLAVALAGSGSVLTASNVVPATKAGQVVQAIGPNNLKPSQCAAITLTNKISGSGTITGTAGSDLITGGAAADTINAGDGSDCLLGGGADDTLSGQGGTGDVCIGGPGTDTFPIIVHGCETQIQ